MKCFVSLLFVSACAMAKSMSGFNTKSTLMSGNGYLTADARNGWDTPATTTTFIDQTFQRKFLLSC
jgi:hypothetical protein